MQNPALYHESNSLHRRDVAACLKKYTPKLNWKKNNRVIDIGCGDGSVTKLLQKFLPTDFKLLGCDISEKMVKYASDHYTDKQTSFTVLDIAGDHPESLHKNFDHAFSFYAINWVINQKRAFENIFNLLDSYGECVILLVARNNVFDVYRNLSQNKKWSAMVYDVERFVSPYHDSKEPDKEIMNQMKDVGFVDVEAECKDMSFPFDDEETARKLMTAVNPFEIPDDQYQDFMDDYIQVLKEVQSHKVSNNNSSKGVTLYYQSVIVKGRKPSSSKMY